MEQAASRGCRQGIAAMPGKKSRVYFTVDTETSMGGAWRGVGSGPLPAGPTIFGENGSKSYGVPLIMDILEEHGFFATFFIEVFCSYLLGFDEVAKVFEYIARRGHDVQLHLHPVYRFYRDYLQGRGRREQDLMFQFPIEEQRELVHDGVNLFREFSGKMPRAFRAGCYGASETTLGVLRENGVLIDSSYNLSYLDRTCGFQRRPLNAPEIVEGVHEFPVTNFNSGRPGSYKALEISAVSVWEILNTVRQLKESGCSDVVLVFHSFSFLKRRGVRFEQARPDRIVISRFRRLCSELSRMRDEVEVSVLGKVDLLQVCSPQPEVIPSLGWFRPGVRKVVQGLDYLPWV
jgi:peptidoglycan/xylan/chitin deacetylase (PgdA/CDA1 family)